MHVIRLIRTAELLLAGLIFMSLFYFSEQVFISYGMGRAEVLTWPLYALPTLGLLLLLGSAFIFNDQKDLELDRNVLRDIQLLDNKISLSYANKVKWILAASGSSILILICIISKQLNFLLFLFLPISLAYLYSLFKKSNYLRVIIKLFIYLSFCLIPILWSLDKSKTALQADMHDVEIFNHYILFVLLSSGLVFYRENIRYINHQKNYLASGSWIVSSINSVFGWLIAGCIFALALHSFIHGDAIDGLFISAFVCIPLCIAWVFGSFGKTHFELQKSSMWIKHSVFALLLFLWFNTLFT